MTEVIEELVKSHGGIVHAYPLRSFELMGQTVSVGLIHEPSRGQDNVVVFVNMQYYITLIFGDIDDT